MIKNFLKKRRKLKICKRILELNREMEEFDRRTCCMRHPCEDCNHLIQVTEHWYSCKHAEYVDKIVDLMFDILGRNAVVQHSFSEKIKMIKDIAGENN